MAATETEARAMIMAGEVFVGDQRQEKAGALVSVNAAIRLVEKCPWVSRGAYKLAEALKVFGIQVQDKVCADAGCSTGGFTDVLLQQGAAKVYAIDSAYGELAYKLRSDPRVVVMERCNVCYLEALPEKVSLVSVDISLLPLQRVLPAVKSWIDADADIITLLKPQYQTPTSKLPEGAVIIDPERHAEIIQEFLADLEGLDLYCHGLIASPLKGSGGNQEFLVWLRADGSVAKGDRPLMDRAGSVEK